MPWNDGKQIKVAGTPTPKSDHGPALAAGESNVYMAYVGKDGENLYFSFLDIDAEHPSTWQNAAWQGNQRVKLEDGSEPQANSRPALAFFFLANDQGQVFYDGPVLIFADKKTGGLRVFYLAQGWTDRGYISAFPQDMVFSQPIVAGTSWSNQFIFRGELVSNVGEVLHLVALDDKGNPWHSSLSFDIQIAEPIGIGFVGTGSGGLALFEDAWSPAQKIDLAEAAGKNVKHWGLSSDGGGGRNAFLFGFTESFIYVFRKQQTDSTFSYLATQLAPEGGINPATAAACPLGSSLNLIYTPKGNSEVFTATNLGSPGDLGPPSPVAPNNVAAKTNSVVGSSLSIAAEGVDERMLIAWKGNSSDHLFFGYQP